MAEDANEEVQEEPKKKGGMGKFIIMGVVLLALIGGAAVSFLIIAPMLADEEELEEPMARESSTDFDELPEVSNMVIKLEQNYVNLMRSGDNPAPMLVYGVSLECNNQLTLDLVAANQHRFEDMIMKLHDSHTREELDDILMFKESVQRKAHQKANDLLRRLQEDKPADNIKITKVTHYNLMVQDPPR